MAIGPLERIERVRPRLAAAPARGQAAVADGEMAASHRWPRELMSSRHRGPNRPVSATSSSTWPTRPSARSFALLRVRCTDDQAPSPAQQPPTMIRPPATRTSPRRAACGGSSTTPPRTPAGCQRRAQVTRDTPSGRRPSSWLSTSGTCSFASSSWSPIARACRRRRRQGSQQVEDPDGDLRCSVRMSRFPGLQITFVRLAAAEPDREAGCARALGVSCCTAYEFLAAALCFRRRSVLVATGTSMVIAAALISAERGCLTATSMRWLSCSSFAYATTAARSRF